PIDLDAAALNHEVLAVAFGVKEPLAEKPGRHLRYAAVLLPVVMLGPSVEVEMHDGSLSRRPPSFHPLPSALTPSPPPLYERRTRVARPAPIGRVKDEFD